MHYDDGCGNALTLLEVVGISGSRERERERARFARCLGLASHSLDGGKQAYKVCLLALAGGAFVLGFATENGRELIRGRAMDGACFSIHGHPIC